MHINEPCGPANWAVVTVGICERVWSNYGWTQSKLRSKLLPWKGRMLMMLCMALRLMYFRESGVWQPGVLEWVEDHRLFGDEVALCDDRVDAVFGVLEESVD